MNRLFFRPDQAGLTKTEAACRTLADINPDVVFEHHTYNIASPDNFDHFIDRICRGSKTQGRVDLVLSCVDNFEARMAINQACNELGQTWMESGVSEDAVSGHIQLLVPGQTACFACAPPLIVAAGDEKTLKRDGVCAASLPTTMGVIAGLLVQNALKHMLGFGTVSPYVGYNALKDFFPTWNMMPNPSCSNTQCCRRQAEHQEYVRTHPPAAVAAAPAETKPLHEDNEFGISVLGSSDDQAAAAAAKTGGPALPAGIAYAYTRAEEEPPVVAAEDLVQTEEQDVAALMASLKSM
eukprot:TRINITY_DN10191_c0_g1_i1.p2 TRINITY_DN10191_c0_g1~~TRINITY_DN10191_c0_g1_i1.p2  ORF type:complete len:328 (-),score=93.20 TRINITY_DN10191_c0_g1_i1:73-957(-)